MSKDGEIKQEIEWIDEHNVRLTSITKSLIPDPETRETKEGNYQEVKKVETMSLKFIRNSLEQNKEGLAVIERQRRSLEESLKKHEVKPTATLLKLKKDLEQLENLKKSEKTREEISNRKDQIGEVNRLIKLCEDILAAREQKYP